MLLMWANPLLGKVGGVWALEISTVLRHFTGPKKSGFPGPHLKEMNKNTAEIID
jgi:hypothetical protein